MPRSGLKGGPVGIEQLAGGLVATKDGAMERLKYVLHDASYLDAYIHRLQPNKEVLWGGEEGEGPEHGVSRRSISVLAIEVSLTYERSLNADYVLWCCVVDC